ncbi:hypothetical protein PMAYCL1PPCAC_16209, partial [Pristionchus mayeri]
DVVYVRMDSCALLNRVALNHHFSPGDSDQIDAEHIRASLQLGDASLPVDHLGLIRERRQPILADHCIDFRPKFVLHVLILCQIEQCPSQRVRRSLHAREVEVGARRNQLVFCQYRIRLHLLRVGVHESGRLRIGIVRLHRLLHVALNVRVDLLEAFLVHDERVVAEDGDVPDGGQGKTEREQLRLRDLAQHRTEVSYVLLQLLAVIVLVSVAEENLVD